MIYKVGPTGALMDPRAKRKDPRPSARKRGYDKAHERRRKHFLKANPWCQWLGCTEPSKVMDHIDGNPFNNDPSNHRAYCHSHHSQRTAQDQPGGWAA